MRLRRQICFCGSSVGKYEATSANLASAAAPSANIWLRRLCRQSFCSDGKSGFSAAQPTNIWLRQQIFGYVGKELAQSANSASVAARSANIWIRQLCRQPCCSGGKSGFSAAQSAKFGSVGKYLAASANTWLCRPIRLLRQLRRQIFGSGSSVGNHVAPAANLASRQLSRQIFGSAGKYLAIWLRRQLRRQIIDSAGKLGFCGSSVGKWRTHTQTTITNNNKPDNDWRKTNLF
jgi:hypothetical protein